MSRVSMHTRCDRCGAAATLGISASSSARGVECNGSFRCPSCAQMYAVCGLELTDELREAFYAVEGRWSAVLRDLGSRRIDALRVLRALRQASPSELFEWIRRGEPIAEGALVEVEYVRDRLAEAGADVALQRHGGDGA